MKIPENIKAVIFDMDGLLIDSEVVWAETDTILLQKRGFNPTKELFLRRLGTGNRGTLEIYREEFDMAESIDSLSVERLSIFYEILWKDIQLMDGAKELIENLRNQKIPQAIATGGHTKEKLIEILEHLKITEFFSALVTVSEVPRSKPFPDIFLYAAEKLGIDPSNCLVFEDAPNGAQAGKAAGMTSWGVNQDPIARKELKKFGADEVFSSLSEITV